MPAWKNDDTGEIIQNLTADQAAELERQFLASKKAAQSRQSDLSALEDIGKYTRSAKQAMQNSALASEPGADMAFARPGVSNEELQRIGEGQALNSLYDLKSKKDYAMAYPSIASQESDLAKNFVQQLNKQDELDAARINAESNAEYKRNLSGTFQTPEEKEAAKMRDYDMKLKTKMAEIEARGKQARMTKGYLKDVKEVEHEADPSGALMSANGKPLAATQNDDIQLNGQIITSADELMDMLDSGNLTVKKNIPFFKSMISTDAVLTARNLVDLLGKKRSGAALSMQEEKLYNDLINDPRVLVNENSKDAYRALLTKLAASAEVEGENITGDPMWYDGKWYPTYKRAFSKRAKKAGGTAGQSQATTTIKYVRDPSTGKLMRAQ